MPNSIEIQIADAIASELNGEDFGLEFKAERSYADISSPLEDMDVLKVDVVPWSAESTLNSRGSLLYTVETDVVIRKRFEPRTQDVRTGRIPVADIDLLMKLRQDIKEFFEPSQASQDGRSLADVPDAVWSGTRTMAAYVRGHLKTLRQFTAWIRIEYEIGRVAGS